MYIHEQITCNFILQIRASEIVDLHFQLHQQDCTYPKFNVAKRLVLTKYSHPQISDSQIY